MKIRKALNCCIILSAFSFSQACFAALLTPQGNSGTLEKVAMPATGEVTVEGANQSVHSVGYGLRTKKVVFVNVKVYVGQLFVSDLATFKKDEALASAKNQKAMAFQMHFLRTVDAEKVQSSFREALQKNAVSLKDSDVNQFLEVVKNSGEAKEGQKLTVVGALLPDGQEAILFEDNKGQVSEIKSGKGFIEKIFCIWLGHPSDGGVADLKAALLK